MQDIHLIYMGPESIRLHSDLPNSINIDGEQFLRQFEAIIRDIPQQRELSIEEIVTKLVAGCLADPEGGNPNVEMLIKLAQEIKEKCRGL